MRDKANGNVTFIFQQIYDLVLLEQLGLDQNQQAQMKLTFK